jgi:N6-L-threonylcarbamoyladenine synthase
MITLGIETSCDETAMCLLETQDNQYKILGNIVHSQIETHKEFGGVVPMIAKREHIKNLPIIYEKILKDSGVNENQISRIAVTNGPGLEPALWTGILFAKDLGKRLNIPVIPINHMEGHIVASLLSTSSTQKDFAELKPLDFPTIALLISGGHTELIEVDNIGSYEVLGATVDDAVGEAFDKVARMLELPYPGGPEISKLAEYARNNNIDKQISLPRPMIHSKDMTFSFSGLKTAVLYTLKKIENVTVEQKQDIAREFEDAVTEVLISKTKMAIEKISTQSLIIGGGVIANTHIRKSFEQLAKEYSLSLYLPASGLSGDNALMIALAGTIKPSNDYEGFKADGNLSL